MPPESPLVFHSSAHGGFSSAVSTDPQHVAARKLEHRVQVRFAAEACVIETSEGQVHARPGDAILTGVAGEQWRVSAAGFANKYRPLPPTVGGEPGTYASLRNDVLALRPGRPFDVVLADGISHLHGCEGDWLVDYGDGSFGVVAAGIFGRIYQIIAPPP